MDPTAPAGAPGAAMMALLLEACEALLQRLVQLGDRAPNEGTAALARRLLSQGAPRGRGGHPLSTDGQLFPYPDLGALLRASALFSSLGEEDEELECVAGELSKRLEAEGFEALEGRPPMAESRLSPTAHPPHCPLCTDTLSPQERCLDACQALLADLKALHLRHRRLGALFKDEGALAASLGREVRALLAKKDPWARRYMEGAPAALQGATQAQQGVTAAQERVTAAEQGVPVAHQGVTAAQKGVTAARKGVTAAQKGVTTAQLGVTAAQEGVPPAQQGGTEAQEGVPPAQQGDIAAQEGVPPAQQGDIAAQEGVPPAQQGDTAAQERVTPAQKGVPPAQQGVPAAQQWAPPAQQWTPPAQQGAPAAQQGFTVAQEGVPPAQQVDIAAQEGLPPAQQGDIAAQEGVPPAQQGDTAAQEGVSPSQQGATAARKRVTPAQQGVPPAQQGGHAAQQGVHAAQQGVRAAQQGVPPAQQGVPAAQQWAPPAQQGGPAAQQGVTVAQQGVPAAQQCCTQSHQPYMDEDLDSASLEVWTRAQPGSEMPQDPTPEQGADLVMVDRQEELVYYIKVRKNPRGSGMRDDEVTLRALLKDPGARVPGNRTLLNPTKTGYQVIFFTTKENLHHNEPPVAMDVYRQEYRHRKRKCHGSVNLNSDIPYLSHLQHNIYCCTLCVEKDNASEDR